MVSFILMTEAPRRASRASGQGARSDRRRRQAEDPIFWRRPPSGRRL